MQVNTVNIISKYNQAKIAHGNNATDDNLSRKQKTIVLATSALGTFSMLAICAKKQKINLFKLKELKKLDIGTKEIFALATGSLVGGLGAGLILDKQNRQNKYRESLQQLVGNIAFPIAFVSIFNSAYKKIEPKIPIPKFRNKVLNAVIKSVPPVVATAVGLLTGIVIGNKIANTLNNKLFKENEHRKVHISDFAAHVDDTLLGVTLVTKNLVASPTSIVSTTASKLIPPALVVPGYVTGTATHKNKH